MKNRIAFGYICLFIWCLFSGYSRVSAADLIRTVDPFTLCFYIFLFSIIFFWCINFKKWPSIYNKIRTHKKEVWHYNATTFGTWFFVIYPLKYIEPSLVTCISLIMKPVFIFIFLSWWYPKDRRRFTDLIFCSGFIVLLIYIIFIIFDNRSSMHVTNYTDTTWSMLSILLGAFSLAWNNIYAKRLSDNGFHPSENLAVRFFVLVILSGLMAPLYHHSIFLPWHQLKALFILSFSYSIIPLYFSQISIRELKPVSYAVATPIMPLIIYAFQGYFDQYHLSLWSLMALIMGFLWAMCSMFFQHSKKSKLILLP